MAGTVAESMTPNPTTIEANRTVRDAADLLASGDVGAVVVVDDGKVVGIVTDRDIVVRIVATGRSPEDPVRQACSQDLVTTTPDTDAAEAVRLMRERAVRRIPVLQGGSLVGILSIGDLAIDRDPTSALADISAEEPNT
ncbi:CBS domain-containing protein [Georgenia satyanarayanai]|uniref:CBS domain-containing protein n=1 Tax=Georgenia satyanarayanai TaxID=860221 RepID=UPI00126449BC|nr:CBS domain-containing protein [Georgenia satyanarayanai]